MHLQHHRLKRAIATTELVVLAMLVLFTVGLVVPIVEQREASDRRARTLGDLRQLAHDVTLYYGDTGTWPSGFNFAHTDGPAAEGEEISFGSSRRALHIRELLLTNRPPVPNWRGPYLSLCRPDGWGNRYVVVLDTSAQGKRPSGWVLSAGPDQCFNTAPHHRVPAGDDLGIRLR
jgi:hypothetical protein